MYFLNFQSSRTLRFFHSSAVIVKRALTRSNAFFFHGKQEVTNQDPCKFMAWSRCAYQIHGRRSPVWPLEQWPLSFATSTQLLQCSSSIYVCTIFPTTHAHFSTFWSFKCTCTGTFAHAQSFSKTHAHCECTSQVKGRCRYQCRVWQFGK